MVTNKDMNLVVKIANARKMFRKVKDALLKPFRKVYFLVENNFLYRRPEVELRMKIAQGRVVVKTLKTDPYMLNHELGNDVRLQRIEETEAAIRKLQKALNKKLQMRGNPDKPEDVVVSLEPANMSAKSPKFGGS